MVELLDDKVNKHEMCLQEAISRVPLNVSMSLDEDPSHSFYVEYLP